MVTAPTLYQNASARRCASTGRSRCSASDTWSASALGAAAPQVSQMSGLDLFGLPQVSQLHTGGLLQVSGCYEQAPRSFSTAPTDAITAAARRRRESAPAPS